MNDYEYEFKQDIKEKKNIGRNSKYMNRTGKGPIKFPSDYLSNKEKKKLNGPIISYDMGKPMSYEQLIMMPEDLQCLYLQGLMDKFHPSQRALAELFGCSKNRIAYRMREFGIKPAGESHGGKNPYFDAEAWVAWIADGKIPENNIDEIEVVDAYLNKLSDGEGSISKTEPYVSPIETDVEIQKEAVSSVKHDIPKETCKMYSKVLDNALKNEYRGKETDFSVLMDLWNSYLVNSGDWLLNHRLTLGDIKVLLLLQNVERVMAEPYNDMYWDSVLEFVSFVKNNPEAF